MQNVNQTLGKRVRDLRLNADLTIEELAFRAGMHPNYLGDMERGTRNPTVVNISKIADGLNIGISELFASAKGRSLHGNKDYALCRRLSRFLAVLRKNSPNDREFVLSISESIARRFAKNA